jgi:hypothetical protein
LPHARHHSDHAEPLDDASLELAAHQPHTPD